MQVKKLGRAAAAAGLLVLLAPGVAFASWWDGGYGGRNSTSTTERRNAADYRPPPDYAPPSECCGGPPPPPPAPVGPIYGCENGDLAGTALALDKTTTPPEGTPVAPGDEILVDISWRVSDWSAPFLHKALDCVYINGVFVPGMSLGEHDTPNDGHFAISYVVPLDAPVGGTICDQGFVSGPNGYDDYFREVSNVVCFPICAPVNQPPPPVTPPVEETTTTTTTTTPPEEEQPYALSERLEQQAPATPPVPQPLAVLPRTGSGPGAARLAAGGLALLTLIRRRTRRR